MVTPNEQIKKTMFRHGEVRKTTYGQVRKTRLFGHFEKLGGARSKQGGAGRKSLQ